MSRITRVGMLEAAAAIRMKQAPARAEGECVGDRLKVVVHVNLPEPGRPSHGLKHITRVLEEAPDTRVEVSCHGAGIGPLERACTALAKVDKPLMERGIRFVDSERMLRREWIREGDLLPGIGVDPSGAVEVVRERNREGDAYSKP